MIQKPVRGMQINKTHPLAKGLVGCWLFNEATGETVFDLSGNGNSGTLENGIIWGNDGLDLDGTNDYVDIPTPPITGSQDRTIIASIKTNTHTREIVSWGTENTGQESRLGINSDGEFFFGVYNGAAIFESITDNQKHCVVITTNGSLTDSVLGYLDGNSSIRSGLISQTINTANANGAIGRKDSIAERYFNGSIYYIFIYNRTLSAYEIAWLSRKPYAMFEPAFSLGALYAALPPALKPMWYYNTLKRRNR